jgi:hypothetical protein
MTPSEIILRKRLVAAGLNDLEWKQVANGLRQRAFWSARVENVRFLQDAQARLGDLLANATTRRAR